MPTNNFKLFDQNKANLLSDTEYANATQRLNGVQTGVASSQLNNKFAYQVSLVAYAIAQIMNQNGLDASDTLSVSAFVGNLGGALLQKVADKASSAEAAAGVLSNKYITPETMKAAALLLSGGVMSGTLDMNNNQIINLPTPTSNSEPATKGYVDGGQIITKKLAYSSSNLNLTTTRFDMMLDISADNIKKCVGILLEGTFISKASSSNWVSFGANKQSKIVNDLSNNSTVIVSLVFYFDAKSSSKCVKWFYQNDTALLNIGYDGNVYTSILAGRDTITVNNFKIYALLLN